MKPGLMIVRAALVSLALAAGLQAQDAAVSAAPATPAKPDSIDGLLASLADIELSVTVDRDFAGADKALTELLIDVEAKGHSAWMQDPRVAQAVTRIRGGIVAARRDDGDELQKSVASAIEGNDEITLTTLGTRAAAVIRASLEGVAGPLTDVPVDRRVDSMLRLDPDASLGFFKTDPLRLGPENVGTVLNQIVRHLPWIVHEGRRPALDHPEWLECIAVILESPSATGWFGDRNNPNYAFDSFNGLIISLAVHDAFTSRLSDDAIRIMSGMDGYFVLDVLRVIDGAWFPSAQPMLEHFVVDERPLVRRKAAQLLVAADTSTGLRSRVRDSDEEVRLSLVESLGPRSRRVLYWRERSESPVSNQVNVAAPEDAEACALLATLAADADPAVREKCVGVLDRLKQPLDADVYRRLAADPDPLVRTAMVALDHPEAGLQTELQVALARDGEPRVVHAIEQRLAQASWSKNAESRLPVLVARLENTSVPLGDAFFLSQASALPAVRRECTQQALRSGDLTALTAIAKLAVLNDRNEVRNHDAVREWAMLPGADLARLLPMLQSVAPSLPVGVAYASSNRTLDTTVPDALDPLARAADQPLRFRLSALGLALHDPTDARLSLLIQLCSDPSLGPDAEDSDDYRYAVGAAIGGIPPARRNAAARDVLTKTSLSNSLHGTVLNACNLTAPDADAIVHLLLADWLDQGETWDLVEAALVQVGQTPALADEDSLRRAARSGHWGTALRALGRLRDPRYLPLLTECLDPTWVTANSNPGPAEHACAAVDALQGYMSDDAASILLNAAANSPYPSVREKALAAVEAIGRYRDALAAWQRRTAGSASRDAAVGQLSAIVADQTKPEDVRAEAVRGLGTLQAIESMPLIIQALQDRSSQVREAARAALDRLNALPIAPATGADRETKKP
jgi:HEAT repeat protein